MAYKNYKQIKAIEEKNKQRLLRLNPNVDEKSGIYTFVRADENGINYCYVGQAKHLLTRLAQHLMGYQHIDLSLKKRGLFNDENPYGWKFYCYYYPTAQLDEMEQKFIKDYALQGFQMLNKTSGSQGVGKQQTAEFRPSKGYHDGLKQGYKNAIKDMKHIIDKHLVVAIKPEKANNKVSVKAFEKFNEILNGE